jgi:hypothetical protein
LARSVPLSRFTSQVVGGSAFFVRAHERSGSHAPISLGQSKADCVSRELHGFLDINLSFFALNDTRCLTWSVSGWVLPFVPELDYYLFYFLHTFRLFDAP